MSDFNSDNAVLQAIFAAGYTVYRASSYATRAGRRHYINLLQRGESIRPHNLGSVMRKINNHSPDYYIELDTYMLSGYSVETLVLMVESEGE